MVKTPVRVIVRTRPTDNFATKNIMVNENTEERGYVNNQQENWSFTFEKVLQNVSQEVMFDISCKDIANSVIEGYSGTVMCYGQTGAGKTFTISGSQLDYKYRGIIPRAVNMIFQEISQRFDQQITVRCSYLEIYNELLTDLLAMALQPDKLSQLSIQEDKHGLVHVKGLLEKIVQNEEECLSMLFEGDSHRTISYHKLNKNSSRSHTIFQLHLETKSRVESSEKIIISKLNLVDLAGSERTKKTNSQGQTLIEAQFINKSLSFLEQIVVSLTEKSRDHIPYRQSKLTNLLKDSIGGNCKTVLVCNIWPESYHLEVIIIIIHQILKKETISTLKFGTRMQHVQNESNIIVHLDPSILLKKYEKEIKDLRQELTMHDTLANRGRIQYEPYTPEQQYEQQLIVQKFLKGDLEDIEFESLRQVKELFIQFKNTYRNLAKDIQENQVQLQKTDNLQNTQQNQISTNKTDFKNNMVGIEDNKFGFGLGKASKDAKPKGQQLESLVIVDKDKEQIQNETQLEAQIEDDQIEKVGNIQKKLVNVDKNQVYLQFRDKEGKEYNEAIVKNVNDLKQKRGQVKQLTQIANDYKNQIDMLKEQLIRKQEGKNQEEIQQGIIDEEEFNIINKMKDLKKDFRTNLEQIKRDKNSILLIEQNIQSVNQYIANQFQFSKWFKKKYGISVHDLENPLINFDNDSKSEELEEQNIDHESLIYIQTKKKVAALKKARKQEKYK